MRTVQNLSVPQNTDPKFPYGTVLNETEVSNGTPIVEEILGDILTNNYKLLQDVGITPNGIQDNDETQYQILDALKILPNKLNDIEQVLTLTSTTWSIPLNLDYLPEKYFFIARASDNYVSGISYNFVGDGELEYGFTSSGFKTGDELLVILDSSNVRAYSLSSIGSTSTEVYTVLGNPLAFNDTNKIWYEDSGVLLSDVPSADYLETIIRGDLSDNTILVNDILVLNGYVLCFCIKPSTTTYFFRQLSLSDLSVSIAVTLSGTSFSSASDLMPYVYVQQGFVYVTNDMNNQSDEFVTKLAYNPSSHTLTYVSTTELDSSFKKTSNAVIKSGLLYTMVSGIFESYNLSTGAKITIGNYSGVTGNIFAFNGSVYFGGGDVAKKLTL